jgi:hypothetical protein
LVAGAGVVDGAVGAVAEGGGVVVPLLEAELAPQPPSAKVREKNVI